MKLKQLISEEDAVSPVIGVILMVAITVILAAVIGTFVLGLGDQVQSSAPNANFQFEYSNMGSGVGTVTITHNGGQDVEAGQLTINIDGDEYDPTTTADPGFNSGSTWSGSISTGDSAEFEESSSNEYSGGETVRVIWSSPSGGSSNTIGSSTVPS